MMPKTKTSVDDAAEEWLTPVNWEEDPAIKAKRRRRRVTFSKPLMKIIKNRAQHVFLISITFIILRVIFDEKLSIC